MTIQPDHSTLSVEGLRDLLTMRTEALARVIERAELAEGVIRERANVYRAGLMVISLSRKNNHPLRPSDIIHLAEYPDLAHAWDNGGDDLDGPVALTDEPGGDAMRWTP
jgi:hypothetical protein